MGGNYPFIHLYINEKKVIGAIKNILIRTLLYSISLLIKIEFYLLLISSFKRDASILTTIVTTILTTNIDY